MATERDERNTERLRQAYAAFSRGDFDAAIELALVRQHTTARGAGSGIEVDTYTWGVWTIDDDDFAIRLEIFQEPDEAAARRATGLDVS